MKLRVRAFGLAVGIVMGLGIFLITVIEFIRGYGNTLVLLQAVCYGYNVCFLGAVVGFFWGVIYGFLFGAAVAWLYNILHKVIYKS